MSEELERIAAETVAAIEGDAAAIEAKADAKDEDATPGPLGLAIALADGRVVRAGATDTGFPIQSIAKVFALDLALAAVGDDVFERVGREPSGDPFNSIIDLERNDGVPRNPFVNAGALAVVDLLVERGRDVVDFVSGEVGGAIALDEDVLASERDGGDLNRAMLSFMRHHGNLRSAPDDVMEAYVRQCAIALDCVGLARAGLFLTRTRLGGDDAAARRRRVLALMMTCGHYDGSGDFAMRVGVPAKSGVGGGILAVVPEVAAIAVWSRNLDQHGNSILGIHALEAIAAATGWSVFGPPVLRL